jgi:hypothetical protein
MRTISVQKGIGKDEEEYALDVPPASRKGESLRNVGWKITSELRSEFEVGIAGVPVIGEGVQHSKWVIRPKQGGTTGNLSSLSGRFLFSNKGRKQP